MLPNTFCHASGIGPKSESQIWNAGLHTWSDFVDCTKPPLAPRKAAALKELARTSMDRRGADDPDYFYRQLRLHINLQVQQDHILSFLFL